MITKAAAIPMLFLSVKVVGVKEVKCESAEDLTRFYADCMENRSTTSTKLNDR